MRRVIVPLSASAVILFLLQQGAIAAETKYRDPGLKKVVQIAIVVRDIEAASRRWADFLGVDVPKITTTRPGREVQMTYRGKPSDGRVKLAFFNLGQVALELLQPVGEGTSWKEVLDKKGEGVHHIGFQVVDLGNSERALEKDGMPVIHKGRYDSQDGTYVYFDSEKLLGVMIELLHSDKKK